MVHIIINKNTGKIIGDKIYTTEGRANGVIKKANASDKSEWIAVPMPSRYTLKLIAEGMTYTTRKHDE